MIPSTVAFKSYHLLMHDDDAREKQFFRYLKALIDRAWKRERLSGIHFDQLTEYEQENIALAFFNSTYGANGLIDYVACHERELLDFTLRGLVCIGATRLATIVRAYYNLLQECGYGWDHPDRDVIDFVNQQFDDVRRRFDDLQAEAADLYSDFYSRWWRYHFERMQ